MPRRELSLVDVSFVRLYILGTIPSATSCNWFIISEKSLIYFSTYLPTTAYLAGHEVLKRPRYQEFCTSLIRGVKPLVDYLILIVKHRASSGSAELATDSIASMLYRTLDPRSDLSYITWSRSIYRDRCGSPGGHFRIRIRP